MQPMQPTQLDLPAVQLGKSSLKVAPICLGTMTFGEQVAEAEAHTILARSLERGVNFLDTAEMYSVPARAETFGETERIIGAYFAANPGVRNRWVVATKVAGPARGMNWVREGKADLTAADIVQACNDSLKRLQTDVIDLYQVHWPVRNAPAFGNPYFDPKNERAGSAIDEQLEGFAQLVRA
jgi:aryl-alcohol dehydrogenase-like predicted oxidoreductase